jgi:signal transduction histidine kinase
MSQAAIRGGEEGVANQRLVSAGPGVAAGAGVAAGLVAIALIATDDHGGATVANAVFALVIGWSFIGAGVIAWERRPDNRTGALLVVGGFAWFATFLDSSDWAPLYTAGTAVEAVYIVIFAYLLLSFPTGRLGRGLDRALIVAGAATATVLELAWLLFAESSVLLCRECPANVLQVTRNDALAEALLVLQRVLAVATLVAIVAVVLHRYRRGSAPFRRAVAPVLLAGSAAFAALAASVVNELLGAPLGPAPEWISLAAFAAIPFAFLTGLLRTRFARGAVADLVRELRAPSRPDLRELLAKALGDPSLELAYWLPKEERYVDREGLPVELPAASEDRAATIVESDGRKIGALIHDGALLQEPALVEGVAATAALALENERLQAELRARLEELRASRARVVETAESERRRIERNLHDGTQQRLVSLAMTLGLAERRLHDDPASAAPLVSGAREELLSALQELRELAQGIHPSILTERGLAAAVRELAFRATIPVEVDVSGETAPPSTVAAAAYFVVCEALANIGKHANASVATVRIQQRPDLLVVEVADDGAGGAALHRGSGLQGLHDRVEVLGGSLRLTSPAGRGTVLRAELPCAS